MPDLKKMLTLEALSEALPSWLKRSTKPEYNADEIDSTLTTNQFVTASDKENWNAKGTYSKPSGGIPKSDLSSIVQTSLEKADSALQSETDPTVPSWAKQTNKPSYTQDEVADGSTYKRVTQTEKNTWNGKQNALTTTQMNAVNSGITSAGVAQISTNQTNIMYAIDTGVKNRLNYNAWKTVGVTGGQAVFENNGVTLTATSGDCYTLNSAASFPVDARIYVTEGEVIVLSWDYEKAANANGYAYIFPEGNVSGSKNAEVSARKIEYTVPANVSYITFRVGVNSGSGHVIKYKDIMVCEKVFYDENQSFLPSALPNYDLTRLEAEDRDVLAEVVDSGAKNLLDLSKCTFIGLSNSYTVSGNTITITSYTTSGGIAELSLTTSQIPTNTDIVLTGCPSGGGSTTYLVDAYDNGTYINGSTDNGSGSSVFRFTTTTQKIRIRLAANYTITNKSFNLMICTKAAFWISPSFVPYRYDPYTTAVQNIANATLYAKRNGRTVTVNGYIDNVSFTAGAQTYLGTINTNIGKPLQQVSSICSVGANGYTFGEAAYLTIATDGNVAVKPNTYSGTGAVFFSVSYTI